MFLFGDHTILVREKHAHAWTEFWSDAKSAWIRYDAVSVLAPARMNEARLAFLESGFLAGISALPQIVLNAFENFSEHMDEYTKPLQDAMPGLNTELFLAIVLFFPLLVALFNFIRNFAKKQTHPVQFLLRSRNRFVHTLQKLGITLEASDTVRTMANKAFAHSKSTGARAQDYANTYEEFRYGKGKLDKKTKADINNCLNNLEKLNASHASIFQQREPK